MSDVFDLDAAVAAEDKADLQEPFRFQIKGEMFEIPVPPPFEAAAVMQTDGADQVGKLVTALLGETDFHRLMKVTDRNRSWEQMSLLIKAYGDFIGASVGESSPSTKRSKTTAKR